MLVSPGSRTTYCCVGWNCKILRNGSNLRMKQRKFTLTRIRIVHLPKGTCIHANEPLILWFTSCSCYSYVRREHPSHRIIDYTNGLCMHRVDVRRSISRVWTLPCAVHVPQEPVQYKCMMCLHKLYCSLLQLQRNYNLFKCQTLPFFVLPPLVRIVVDLCSAYRRISSTVWQPTALHPINSRFWKLEIICDGLHYLLISGQGFSNIVGYVNL